MKDPTRIPEIIAALHTAWEAQPDRALAELWGSLENRGLGWATSDEDLLRLLREEAARHPVSVRPGDLSDSFAVVATESPRRIVTLDPVEGRVTVRAQSDQIRTTTWCGGEIVRLVAGSPLVLRDASGIDHRLGVTREITVHPRPETIDLSRVERRALGDRLYGANVSRDGSERPDLIVVGHSLEIQTVGLRAVDTRKFRFERLVTCRVGEALVVTERGGRRRELGVVEQLFPLDA